MSNTDFTEPSEDEMAMTEALAEAQEELDEAEGDLEMMHTFHVRDQRIIEALLDKGDTDKQIRTAYEEGMEAAAVQLRNAQEYIATQAQDINHLRAERQALLHQRSQMTDNEFKTSDKHKLEIKQRDEDIATLVHVLQAISHDHPTILARVPERFLDGWPVASPREPVSTPATRVRAASKRLVGVDYSDKPDGMGIAVCSVEGAQRATGQGANSGDGADYCLPANTEVPPHHNS